MIFARHPPGRGGLTNNSSKMGLFVESTLDSWFNREFVIARNEQMPQGERAFDGKSVRGLFLFTYE